MGNCGTFHQSHAKERISCVGLSRGNRSFWAFAREERSLVSVRRFKGRCFAKVARRTRQAFSMKPFRRDPCAVCGHFLIEHSGDRKDVRCSEHKNWARPKEPPPAPPFMRVGDRGETVNPKTGERIPPPTIEWRHAPNVVCTTCYFVTGGAFGALLTLALIWFR